MSVSTARWGLWRRQVKTLASFEIKRCVFGRRALSLYVLAAMPILLGVLRAIFMSESERLVPARTVTEFAHVFHFFLLRMVVFFSCAFVFVKLIRGEILERSLHYTLLAPIKRQVLVLGKYLGGLGTVLAVLLPTMVLSYLLFFLPHGSSQLASHLGSAAGMGNLVSYLVVVTLACAGYGAVFMLAGLFFKNPMVPAVLLLGWEILTPFLPTFLKALSLVHYLSSLTPVPVTMGPFALVAQPVAPWLAVVALLGGSALLLTLSSWRASVLEITYASE